MSEVPARPKIYHITHLQNLAAILEAGVLWSDAKRLELALECEVVGMSEIKRRRLEELPVTCYSSTRVGHYVPFYFCPRSIMLYILHMGNHPELSYHGGQMPIVHLVADLHATVEWAQRNDRKWAFSDSNAGAKYTNFCASVVELDKVNWTAVAATDFRNTFVKDGKQAEFLVHDSFPWNLVEQIGVIDSETETQVRAIVANTGSQPQITVQRAWYF